VQPAGEPDARHARIGRARHTGRPPPKEIVMAWTTTARRAVLVLGVSCAAVLGAASPAHARPDGAGGGAPTRLAFTDGRRPGGFVKPMPAVCDGRDHAIKNVGAPSDTSLFVSIDDPGAAISVYGFR
jgi:hypothetical protein